jgi:hypothetical protein
MAQYAELSSLKRQVSALSGGAAGKRRRLANASGACYDASGNPVPCDEKPQMSYGGSAGSSSSTAISGGSRSGYSGAPKSIVASRNSQVANYSSSMPDGMTPAGIAAISYVSGQGLLGAAKGGYGSYKEIKAYRAKKAARGETPSWRGYTGAVFRGFGAHSAGSGDQTLEAISKLTSALGDGYFASTSVRRAREEAAAAPSAADVRERAAPMGSLDTPTSLATTTAAFETRTPSTAATPAPLYITEDTGAGVAPPTYRTDAATPASPSTSPTTAGTRPLVASPAEAEVLAPGLSVTDPRAVPARPPPTPDVPSSASPSLSTVSSMGSDASLVGRPRSASMSAVNPRPASAAASSPRASYSSFMDRLDGPHGERMRELDYHFARAPTPTSPGIGPADQSYFRGLQNGRESPSTRGMPRVSRMPAPTISNLAFQAGEAYTMGYQKGARARGVTATRTPPISRATPVDLTLTLPMSMPVTPTGSQLSLSSSVPGGVSRASSAASVRSTDSMITARTRISHAGTRPPSRASSVSSGPRTPPARRGGLGRRVVSAIRRNVVPFI